MGIFDVFKSGSDAKKERIRENAKRGAKGEVAFRYEEFFKGNDTERTGKGSDYRVRKGHPLDGVDPNDKGHLAEVKTGKAKLSKLQKKTQKENSDYQVSRKNPFW